MESGRRTGTLRFATVCLMLLVAAFAVLPVRPADSGFFFGATLTVNSSGSTDFRDDTLSLREAMMLAISDLGVSALFEGECAQVSTAEWNGSTCGKVNVLAGPGGSHGDRIVFDSNRTITLFGSPLPTLDTGGDTIDASATGATINGSGSQSCIRVESVQNTVRGLDIHFCDVGVRVVGNDNRIGGSGPGEGNTVSGHANGGIGIDGSGNSVIGNMIGVSADGQAAFPNGGPGIVVYGQMNTIADNVISGNVLQGIRVDFGGQSITGNHVGTNAAGTAAIPNAIGMEIRGGGSIIGGTSAEDRNLVSGNTGAGIRLGVFVPDSIAHDSRVIGNYVGTDVTGTSAIPNGGNGFEAVADEPPFTMSGNEVGGPGPGEGNIIAYNGGFGVQVTGSRAHTEVRGNSIHSNVLGGIDNANLGNVELPAPTITGFGSVTGTSCGNCTIDVYSDNGSQGRVYEGSTLALGSGEWTFDGVPGGPNVTATATDASGHTSEFSAPASAPAPATPTPSPSPATTPTPNPGGTQTPTPTPTPTGTTPTPTPTGGPVLAQGDNDCDGDTDAVDALKGLQHVAAIEFEQEDGCPEIGGAVPAGAPPEVFGDVDCDGDVDAVDALKILQFVAAITFTQDEPCVDLGEAF